MEGIDRSNIETTNNGSTAEDIRAAYQAYPQMITYEGQNTWSATSVFIQNSQ